MPHALAREAAAPPASSSTGRAVRLALLLVAAVGGAATAGRAAETTTPSTSVGQRWLANRLSLGARWTRFWLEDTRRSGDQGYDNANLAGNFLGSLWGLDARQHYVPSPFLEYRVVSSVGVGLAYDQARARTLDWTDETKTATAGDGDVEIRGLQLYVFGRYPNATRVTPHARVGYASYWSQFFVSPGWSAPGRRFEVDDTRGWLLAAGVSVALHRHLALDVSYQRTQLADVTARAYFNRNRHRAGAFPMTYDALVAGLAYAF